MSPGAIANVVVGTIVVVASVLIGVCVAFPGVAPYVGQTLFVVVSVGVLVGFLACVRFAVKDEIEQHRRNRRPRR